MTSHFHWKYFVAGMLLPILLVVAFILVGYGVFLIGLVVAGWAIARRPRCPFPGGKGRILWWAGCVSSFLLGISAGVLIMIGIGEFAAFLKRAR